MLIPSALQQAIKEAASLSRRVNANSQLNLTTRHAKSKLIKKGEC